jgi:hypothetical protein
VVWAGQKRTPAGAGGSGWGGRACGGYRYAKGHLTGHLSPTWAVISSSNGSLTDQAARPASQDL